MKWFNNLPHPYKIAVCGNHETNKSDLPDWFSKHAPNTKYLVDSELEIEGIKLFGCEWHGKYDTITENLDILITHIPPGTMLIGKVTKAVGFGDKSVTGESRGSSKLASIVKKVKPKIHVFGHNHGQQKLSPL